MTGHNSQFHKSYRVAVLLGEQMDDGFTVDSRLVNKENIEAFCSKAVVGGIREP